MKNDTGIFENIQLAISNISDADKILLCFEEYKDICNDLMTASVAGLYKEQTKIIIASLYLRFYSYLKQFCKEKNISIKEVIIEMKKQSNNVDDKDEKSRMREEFFDSKLLINDFQFGQDENYTLKCIGSGLHPYDILVKCVTEEFILSYKK